MKTLILSLSAAALTASAALAAPQTAPTTAPRSTRCGCTTS